MKKGDIVMVYQDPLTQNKPEGKAKLLHLWDNRDFYKGTRFEVWEVQFQDEDGRKCERVIKSLDKNKEALDSFFAKNI